MCPPTKKGKKKKKKFFRAAIEKFIYMNYNKHDSLTSSHKIPRDWLICH